MFQRNCRRLVALINDFLDFSRIEAGAVRLERAPFRIRETVNDAVATFREAAARKGIALGVEIDPAAHGWALGDPLRIQQVLVNLLSNALKFTDSRSRGCERKSASERGRGRRQFRFEVRDTGPGIGLEDQDKIFARFVQLPNQSNGQRGAGLGLTICRDLVELMGGEIGVVSREGSGSAFHFSLPLEAVEPVPAEPDAAPDRAPDAAMTGTSRLPASEPIRILLAEDTEDNRLLLEHYLDDQPVEASHRPEWPGGPGRHPTGRTIRSDPDGHRHARDGRLCGDEADPGLAAAVRTAATRYSDTHHRFVGGRHARSGARTAWRPDAWRTSPNRSTGRRCSKTIRHFAPAKASQGAPTERTMPSRSK